MSLPAAILHTVLIRLARLFLAGAQGDETAARHAAAQMLAAYDPQTADELRLAANIISFSFHGLEALSQATTPDLPLTRILRLRGSAVSLSRESHKAERRLEQRHKARRDAITTEPPLPEPRLPEPRLPEPLAESLAEPDHPNPAAERALDLIADTRAVADLALQTKQTWTQAYHQRQRDKHLAKQSAKRQTSAIHATVM
jgi:hypothetical protein